MVVRVFNVIEDENEQGDIWKSKDASFYQFTSRMNSIASGIETQDNSRKFKPMKKSSAELYGWRPNDEVVKEKLI